MLAILFITSGEAGYSLRNFDMDEGKLTPAIAALRLERRLVWVENIKLGARGVGETFSKNPAGNVQARVGGILGAFSPLGGFCLFHSASRQPL